MSEKENSLFVKAELTAETTQLEELEVGYTRNFFDEDAKKVGDFTITLDNEKTIKAEVKLEF